jgi:hypothetical protein
MTVREIYVFLGLMTLVAFCGCKQKSQSAWEYFCAVPGSQLHIAEDTDTNIRRGYDHGTAVLTASRDGNDIIVPFSQCVALRRGSNGQ